MSVTPVIVLSVSLCGAAAHGQLLSNSFESHSATETQFNRTNAQLGATLPGVTGFGGATEIDLITFPGFAGATPIRGNWMLGLHANFDNLPVDAFSMALSAPVVTGGIYQLTMVGFQGSAGSPGTIELGLSNDPGQFGAPLASFTPNAAWGWNGFQVNFLALNDGAYLTVRVSGDNSYVLVDDFVLTPTPGAAVLMGLGGLAAVCRRRS
ncbi:MAG TPA: hypothetical protein VEB22_13700 [Phycisphaerales bacterium]|nr:hypothetical protein [Phycisphaerales bacterium]